MACYRLSKDSSRGSKCSYCGYLFSRTILSSCIGDTGDQPFAVLANEIEQVGSTVVDFAVHEKLERSPHHGQVVVDSHERIVNALRDLRCSRLSDPIGKRFKVI